VSWLETRIPPLVVVAIVAAAMWGTRLLLPALTTPYAGNFPVGLVLLAAGVCVIGEGARQFRRARTTVDPLRPEKATTIVDTGIFRITRNPMYVGMLLILLGWAAYLANVVTLAGPLLFILYMNRFQIGPEERALRRVFGEPYVAYLGRVRRWI
jgi:protein-S-isoprenylcysteine O-methyltransferase Ste14